MGKLIIKLIDSKEDIEFKCGNSISINQETLTFYTTLTILETLNKAIKENEFIILEAFPAKYLLLNTSQIKSIQLETETE